MSIRGSDVIQISCRSRRAAEREMVSELIVASNLSLIVVLSNLNAFLILRLFTSVRREECFFWRG